MSGIYGSSKISTWLRESKSGTDCIDFLFIGDSNTGFGTYGWLDGILQGILNNGILQYGTAVAPLASGGGSTEYQNNSLNVAESVGGRSVNGYVIDAAIGQNDGTPGTHVVALSGMASASATLKANFNSFPLFASSPKYGISLGGNLGDTNPTCFYDFIWVPADPDGWNYNNGGPSIDSVVPNALNKSMLLTYRLLFATEATGSSIVVKVMDTSGTFYNTFNYSFPNTLGVMTAKEFTRTGVGTPAGNLQFGIAGAGVGSPNALRGPIALYMQSLYMKNRMGVAGSTYQYHGGAGILALAIGAGVDPSCRKAMLKEMRERQIAAGGTGRVCIFIQSGLNGDTTSQWQTYIPAYKSLFNTDWAALGYPSDDITFVIMVSHPVNTPDSQSALRVTAKNTSRTTTNTTFINIADLITWTSLDSQSPDWTADAYHLTSAGFTGLGKLIVSQLLDYAPNSDQLRKIAGLVKARSLHRYDIVEKPNSEASLKINGHIHVGIFRSVADAKDVVRGILQRFGTSASNAGDEYRFDQIPNTITYIT